MFEFDVERFRLVFDEITRKGIGEQAWDWLAPKLNDPASFHLTFALIPRKIGKIAADISGIDREQVRQFRPGFSFRNWTVDRLARVCLLAHFQPPTKDAYFSGIESLYLTGEVAELVALYSALPIYFWPEEWAGRCAEGIRSNIAPVLESIMYENPYPSEQLDEAAWNQMVLKAFFTDKDVNRIYGLDERANQRLALTLSDYAHERWAAGRTVDPMLWRLTSGFMDDVILSDLRKVLTSGEESEKKAVLLAINNSQNPDALELLKEFHKEIGDIQAPSNWDLIADDPLKK